MANKAELIKRCEELGINPEPLTTNAQREAAIKAKEAELAASAEVNDPETLEDPAASAANSAAIAASTTEEEKTQEEESEDESPKTELENSEEEESEVAFYEDAQGRKWKFKPTAPKTINIDGHPMTQQEILETEEVISQLVYGNNSFITQKHN